MINSKKLQDLVDTGFLNQEQGEYLEKSITNKENIIVAGHKGHGILVLLSNLATCIDKNTQKLQQVRKPDVDTEKEADVYLIGDLKDTDYDELLTKLYSKKDCSVLTLKDADHNFSLMKIIRAVHKETGDSSKVYVMAECKKINDEKKLFKITRFSFSPEGKMLKEELLKIPE